MTSPTSRSLAWLRRKGWTVCVVEKWNRFAGIRQDAYGFGDLLACRVSEPGTVEQIALIQVTTASNGAARRAKIADLKTAKAWKDAGGWIFLHLWSKKGKRGKRKLWELREEIL